MIKFVDEDEAPVYRVRKGRTHLFIMLFFLSIWLFFGYQILTLCFGPIFSGALPSMPIDYYLLGMIGLLLFIPVAIILVLSYFLNQLVITKRRIYVRKGISGKLHILSLDDVRSFQHVCSTGRNAANHAILFYMHCGKRIKTGNLYATMGSLQDLLVILREKFEGRGFTRQEMKQMALQNDSVCHCKTKINWFVLCLTLAPYLLALIWTIFYFGMQL